MVFEAKERAGLRCGWKKPQNYTECLWTIKTATDVMVMENHHNDLPGCPRVLSVGYRRSPHGRKRCRSQRQLNQ